MTLPGEQRQDSDWVTLQEASTDWEYGMRPEARSVEERLSNGIVLIDKPSGPTSHQVSGWTRDALERGKAGHSGTLDPHVTGVLPIGLDRGTKVLQALTGAGKEYICLMELDEEKSRDELEAVAERLTGTITQVPPEKSAVKREKRDRDIYSLTIIEVSGTEVLFRIRCEKGFYVRTFCEQFGEALETAGEMADLRRTQVGTFTEDMLVSLNTLRDEYRFWQDGEDNRMDELVLPVEAGVRHIRKVLIKDTAVASVCHGADLGLRGISQAQQGIERDELIAVLTLKGELVALANAEMSTEQMQDGHGTAATLERVFMDPDTYPKTW